MINSPIRARVAGVFFLLFEISVMNQENRAQPNQNRKESLKENLNSTVKYNSKTDKPDSGFADMDKKSKGNIAGDTNLKRKDIISPKETGAFSGRQDLSGGNSSSETERRSKTDRK